MKNLLLVIILFFNQSCFLFNENEKISIKSNIDDRISISSLKINNNEVVISGKGLSGVTKIKLSDTTSNYPLKLKKISENNLIASPDFSLSILIGSAYKLILSTASADVGFDISFTIPNGSINLNHLSSLGAVSPGQVLKFNGTSWAPSFITTTQNYKGTWNPTTNAPDDITTLGSYSAGDYFIISTMGSFSSSVLTINPTSFNVGDWVMFNGTSWDKIISGNISGSGTASYVPYYSSSSVLSNSSLYFDGINFGIGTVTPGSRLDIKGELRLTGSASGYVGLSPATNAGSTSYILPAADGSAGQVLSTNGSGTLSWSTPSYGGPISTDDLSEGSSNLYFTDSRVRSTSLSGYSVGSNSSILSSDTLISALSKIQGQINATNSSKEGSITAGTNSQYYRGDKTFQTLDTSVVTENTNLYFTDARAKAACVADSILDSISNIAPSQNAVHDALGGKLSTTGGTLSIGTINGVPLPTSADDVANKDYVDSFAQWTLASSNASRVTGNVGIGTASPGISLDISPRTDGIRLPKGTSGTRPSSPVSGTFRYNTTSASPEYNTGVDWYTMVGLRGGATISTTGLGALSITSSAGQSITMNASTGKVYSTSDIFISSTSDSIDTTTGALITLGGAGISGRITVGGGINPGDDDNIDLGATDKRWKNIYLVNAPDVSSDIRLKKEIQESELGLDFVNLLKPVSWVWKNKEENTRHFGFIAQDTLKLIQGTRYSNDVTRKQMNSSIVSYDQSSDRYGIRYTELIAPIVKAIQDLSRYFFQFSRKSDLRVEKLETQIERLEERLKQLEDIENYKRIERCSK